MAKVGGLPICWDLGSDVEKAAPIRLLRVMTCVCQIPAKPEAYDVGRRVARLLSRVLFNGYYEAILTLFICRQCKIQSYPLHNYTLTLHNLFPYGVISPNGDVFRRVRST